MTCPRCKGKMMLWPGDDTAKCVATCFYEVPVAELTKILEAQIAELLQDAQRASAATEPNPEPGPAEAR